MDIKMQAIGHKFDRRHEDESKHEQQRHISTREETPDPPNDGTIDISPHPTNVLLLQGIDTLTNEQTIHRQFPKARIRMIRDKQTHANCGFAFAEFNQFPEALEHLAKKTVTIDEAVIRMAFGKLNSFEVVEYVKTSYH